MLAALLKVGMKLLTLDLRARLRALTVTAVLTLIAFVILLAAAGFGLALLTVWLQQVLGTMPALAMIAGGCALLALILLAIAFLRPGPRRAAPQAERGGSSERMLEDAIAAVQQGSRESMLAAVVLAVVTGVMLGRKL
jgi:hypothetical protein